MRFLGTKHQEEENCKQEKHTGLVVKLGKSIWRSPKQEAFYLKGHFNNVFCLHFLNGPCQQDDCVFIVECHECSCSKNKNKIKHQGTFLNFVFLIC